MRTLNLSRSGAKTLHVLRDQVPRLDGLVPDLLTVSAGANDIIRLVRRRTLEERLRRLAAALPPGTVLADIPCFGGGSFERKARWASALVAELCEEHGLVRAPLHKFTERDLSRTLYAEDWLHPSDAGYAVWADAMWQAAERARTLWRSSPPRSAARSERLTRAPPEGCPRAT